MTEDRLTHLHTFDIYVLGCGNSSQRTNNPSHVAGFFMPAAGFPFPQACNSLRSAADLNENPTLTNPKGSQHGSTHKQVQVLRIRDH